jgi:phosphohistidine phosphatase
MDLILWRHAEAQVLAQGQDDLDRRLTAAGERQARRMGLWLQQRLPDTTRVWVSPAARTRATADALERPYKVLPELAPDADPSAWLPLMGWPDAVAPVLIVGHQPALGVLAAQLLCGAPLPWSVKKGAVWWLSSRRREGVQQVLLRAVQGTDLL